LYGNGSNGKSVFYDVFTALIGIDNISNYSLEQLTEDKGFYRSMIKDKLVNYGSEISSKMDVNILKQLVSGESVGACYKYGQPFNMNDYGKLFFNCNLLPKNSEQSHGFYRRFLIIPFEKTIEKKDEISGLAQMIIDQEISGVFMWMLEGLTRLLQNGKFTESEKINNAVTQFNTDSDSVKSFIDDGEYQKSVSTYIELKSLFSEYRTYCLDNGLHAVSSKTLSQRLVNYGYKKERKNIGYVFFMERQIK
jgi:putative DNA primase/helicase